MLKIEKISIKGYEKVLEVTDASIQLHGFIAIHNTSLGPALGGTRFYPYKTREEALRDVLRLSEAMTYKAAIAEIGLGGGKSVIMANPKISNKDLLLLGFADAIDQLKGEYIAAEDIGTSPEDMFVMHKKTPYIAALPLKKSSGDPSRFTAFGVFRGLQAISEKLFKTSSLKGKKVLIQGLGRVGSKIAEHLFWQGAHLIFSDVDKGLLQKLGVEYRAKIITPEEVYSTDCDIFCPCALGEVINEQTIAKLKCKAIGGSANNQLKSAQEGLSLMERGILYAPDFIINSGGLINAALEFDPNGYNPKISQQKVDHIYDRLLNLFKIAEKEKKSPNAVANDLALYNLNHLVGKRSQPIHFIPACG